MRHHTFEWLYWKEQIAKKKLLKMEKHKNAYI